MSSPCSVATEIVAELGDRLADLRELAAAIDRAHDTHSLSPAAWVTVERTLLGLRARLRTSPPRATDRWIPRVLTLEADA